MSVLTPNIDFPLVFLGFRRAVHVFCPAVNHFAVIFHFWYEDDRRRGHDTIGVHLK